MIKLKKLMGEGEDKKAPSPMHNEARRHFLEVISTYKAFGPKLQADSAQATPHVLHDILT